MLLAHAVLRGNRFLELLCLSSLVPASHVRLHLLLLLHSSRVPSQCVQRRKFRSLIRKWTGLLRCEPLPLLGMPAHRRRHVQLNVHFTVGLQRIHVRVHLPPSETGYPRSQNSKIVLRTLAQQYKRLPGRSHMHMRPPTCALMRLIC
jgi:hypothetical protein